MLERLDFVEKPAVLFSILYSAEIACFVMPNWVKSTDLAFKQNLQLGFSKI